MAWYLVDQFDHVLFAASDERIYAYRVPVTVWSPFLTIGCVCCCGAVV
jgi:hypothetical protein